MQPYPCAQHRNPCPGKAYVPANDLQNMKPNLCNRRRASCRSVVTLAIALAMTVIGTNPLIRAQPAGPSRAMQDTPPPRAVHARAGKITPAMTAPAPAGTVTPPVETKTGNDERETIRAAVDAWAAAWSRRDVAGYLHAYAPNFSPEDQRSLSEWMKERHARLSARGTIKVTISELQVDMDGNAATVTFTQEYQGDTVRRRGRKALLMVKHGEQWLIQKESILGSAQRRARRGQDRMRPPVR